MQHSPHPTAPQTLQQAPTSNSPSGQCDTNRSNIPVQKTRSRKVRHFINYIFPSHTLFIPLKQQNKAHTFQTATPPPNLSDSLHLWCAA